MKLWKTASEIIGVLIQLKIPQITLKQNSQTLRAILIVN